MKVGHTTAIKEKGLQNLPGEVSPNCYRFFCKVLRRDIFNNMITLEVDGDEITLSSLKVRVGLVGGRLVCDIPEVFAKANKLI